MARNNSEAKIKFTAETSQFNEEIKKSDKTMSNLRAELKLNEAQMQTNGRSVEALEQKHSLLEDQLAAARAKTEALSNKIEVATRLFGENSNEVMGLKTKLTQAQTAEEKIAQAIDKCNREIADQKAAADKANSATGRLTSTIEEQQAEVDALKRAYSEAVLEYGENSDEAKTLEKRLSSLSGELADNKSKLDSAARAADKLDRSIDDTGDSARDAEGGFTVMKGAIADLVAEAVEWGIGKIGEFIDYLKELPEATRELRQDLATLDTSFASSGFTVDQAKNTWKELYTIFGEDDRAVEAANLISKMAKNQEDLNSWVTITQGVWGSYQDSLPVEGLAEASNETAKTGKVTGVLADALNWSGEAASMFSKYMGEDVTTAEDAFNEALKECTTEQERQKLIVDTLTQLYGDAANKYEEASGAQLAEKEAAAEATLAQANLAAAIAPATTEWTKMKTQLVTAVTPALTAVCDGLSKAFGWLQEHPAVMSALAAVLGVLAVAMTVFTVAIIAQTAAQWAQNAAWLANPITWIVLGIVAAVAALVAIFVTLWQKSEGFRNFFIGMWEGIKNAFFTVVNFIKENWQGLLMVLVNPIAGIFKLIYDNCDGFRAIVDNTVSAIKGFFVNLWDSIVNIWNNIVNGIQVAIMFIGSIFSAAWDIITLPFRFIWENCKEYVFAAFDYIKNAISNALSAIGQWFSNTWAKIKAIFAPVANWFSEKFNAAKQGVQNAWASVKNFFSNIWSGIKTAFAAVGSWFSEKFNTAKQGVQNAWSSVKGFFSGIWSGIKGAFSAVGSWFSNTFNKAKEAITKPIEAAKNKVKSVVDAIKGFFNGMKLKFPNIKLPHFKISGSFSLNPPSVPKLKIDWYKDGGIMMRPTIFGMNGNRLMGGGEAGPEAILPIDRLQGYITGAIEKTVQSANIQSLADAIIDLASRPIEMDINGKRFAVATAHDTDNVNGMRSMLVDRGLILD